MIIKKLTASFGKLNGESMELNDGLNVICAPNESGKSTWCAFIRAMLYGVDSAERQKAGYMPDKLRYAPWSGASMQGQMELEANGKDITLTRTTRLKTAPMREFSAVYTGTNVAVEGLTASNAGEALTGVSRDVFRRSAFVEQGAIAVSGSPELEKRISAIVSGGDEDCSYTEADEQLRAWQRSRRYNKRGKLPELEERMEQTKRKINELENARTESERLSEQLENARLECRRLEQEMTECRKTVRLDTLANLRKLRQQVNEANEAHEAADDERDARRAELCSCVIGQRPPDEVAAEVKQDTEECLRLKEISEKKVSPVPAYILFVLALASAAAALFLLPKAYMIYAFAAAVVLIFAAGFVFAKHIKTKNAAHEAKRARHKILSKYKADDEDGINACYEQFMTLFKAFTEAEDKERQTAEALKKIRTVQEQNDAQTLTQLDFNSGSSEAAQLSRELANAQRRCELIAERISEIKGAVSATGDPLVLGSELKSMQSEYEELSNEYEAIALAVETLREADKDIQRRFSPELGKLAAHYMSLMTSGRYEGVFIDRDFSARTKTGTDSVDREMEYLSAGTLDLMYLAVRLAVCELALDNEHPVPLVLDDTLVNFDEQRTEQAMKLLSELAKKRQVILFSCKNV